MQASLIKGFTRTWPLQYFPVPDLQWKREKRILPVAWWRADSIIQRGIVPTFSLELWQCVSCLVFYAGAVDDANFRFRKLYSSMCQLSYSFYHVIVPSKTLMVKPDHEASFFHIKSQKRYRPYNCYALPVFCDQLLLFYVNCRQPGCSIIVVSIILFFLKRTSDFGFINVYLKLV